MARFPVAPQAFNESNQPKSTSGGGGGGSTTLAGLTDVAIAGPTNTQVLTYVSAAGKWENVAAPSGGGGGVSATVVVDTPELHGAKRDGKLITAATYAHTSKTVTCATASFVSGDVGKVIIMRSAATKASFVSTIATVPDGTHITIASDVPGVDLTSTFMVYGTDDTAAINTALTAIVTTAQANGSNAGQLLLSAGIYMIAAATTKTTTNLGNAQIPLPAVRPDLNDKFELEIKGVADGAAPTHWLAATPPLSGTILLSTLQGVTNDGTWGYPSIIGGITQIALNNNGFSGGYGGSSNSWSNCHPTFTNFRLIHPNTPAPLGMDLRGMGTTTIDRVGLYPFNTPVDINSGPPSNQTVGIYMPSLNNNDYSEIGSLTIYGWNYALGVSDHANWKSLRIVYCNSAILINGPNGSNVYVHGIKGGYTSIEGCNVGIDASVFTPGSPGTPRFPVVIDEINFEINNSYHINDPSNFITGSVWMTDTNIAPNPFTINGGKHMRITDGFAPRGLVTLANPATGVAFPKIYRGGWWQLQATTSLSATVDAISVGIASPARFWVAPGATVIPTYTGTLTAQVFFD